MKVQNLIKLLNEIKENLNDFGYYSFELEFDKNDKIINKTW